MGKVPYRSAQLAARVRFNARTHRQDRSIMDVYKCSHCGWWHIGHAAGSAQEKHWIVRGKRWEKRLAQIEETMCHETTNTLSLATHKDSLGGNAQLISPPPAPRGSNRAREIVGVALLLPGDLIVSLPRPHRHHHLLHRLHPLVWAHPGDADKTVEENIQQGFLGSDGSFITREEGWTMYPDKRTHPRELFSEDLW